MRIVSEITTRVERVQYNKSGTSDKTTRVTSVATLHMSQREITALISRLACEAITERGNILPDSLGITVHLPDEDYPDDPAEIVVSWSDPA